MPLNTPTDSRFAAVEDSIATDELTPTQLLRMLDEVPLVSAELLPDEMPADAADNMEDFGIYQAVHVPDHWQMLSRLGPWFVVLASVLAGLFWLGSDERLLPMVSLIGSWAVNFELASAGLVWYILLCGLVVCWPMLRRTQGLGLLDKWLLRAAVGSVVMSVVFFLSGCVDLQLAVHLGKLGIFWPIAFSIVFAVEWRRRVRRVSPVMRETWTVWQMILSLLVTQAVLLNFAGVPAPPLLYDVTEYHLGALSDYGANAMWRAPVYGPVAHNMYARFPFPIEALYHASFAPKMLNALAVLACALLVYAWLERAGIRRVWRLLAAFTVMGHSLMLEVNTDAMIDAPVAFLLLASVYAMMLCAGKVDPILRPKMIPIALLIFSGALCCKYTVGQIYLLPLVIFCVVPLLRIVRQNDYWRWFGLGLALAAMPPLVWLGKNIVWYGNPTEPFFHWMFRPDDLLAIAREQYYIESHFPQSFLSREFWLSFPKRISALGWFLLASLVAYTIPANIFARRDGWRLALIVVVSLLMWNLVGQAQGRFILPSVLMCVIAGIIAMHNTWHLVHRNVDFMFVRSAMVGLAAMMGVTATALTTVQWYRLAVNDWLTYAFEMADDEAAAIKGDVEFYKKNLGALGEVLAEAATTKTLSAKTDNRLLMVYEARPWLWQHLMPNRWAGITYNTVFDQSELLHLAEGAKTPSEITERLQRVGITHVVVNNEELRRFASQYSRPHERRAKGIDDAMKEWHLVVRPEDLYPAFSRDPAWATIGEPVVQWLKLMRRKAVIAHGQPEVEIWFAPLD